jgi:hypothetical protein
MFYSIQLSPAHRAVGLDLAPVVEAFDVERVSTRGAADSRVERLHADSTALLAVLPCGGENFPELIQRQHTPQCQKDEGGHWEDGVQRIGQRVAGEAPPVCIHTHEGCGRNEHAAYNGGHHEENLEYGAPRQDAGKDVGEGAKRCCVDEHPYEAGDHLAKAGFLVVV